MESFASSRRAALRENLLTGAVLLLAAPLALFLLRGERDPAVLAGAGVVTAILGVLLYSVRALWLGTQVVEVTAEEIRVTGRRGERRMEWGEVRSARRTLHGGEAWTLTPHEGRPLVLRLDGFTSAQCARIGELVRARTAVREAAVR